MRCVEEGIASDRREDRYRCYHHRQVVHFRCVGRHPYFEFLRNNARVHLISPPYARVFHREERKSEKRREERKKRRKRRKRRRRRGKKKKKKISGSLTDAEESHVGTRHAWHSHRTEMCTRTQLASD